MHDINLIHTETTKYDNFHDPEYHEWSYGNAVILHVLSFPYKVVQISILKNLSICNSVYYSAEPILFQILVAISKTNPFILRPLKQRRANGGYTNADNMPSLS